MPSCPPTYDCWLQWHASPHIADAGDWSAFLIALVAITLIITVGILIFSAGIVWENTHKSMEFKVK